MTHFYNSKTGLLLLASMLLWSLPSKTVLAQEQCKIPPTCFELGYTLLESDCTGKPTLHCPFNSKKVFCVKSKCKTGTEWCEAKGECIESCKGYSKVANPNMVLCLLSQTKVFCNDCNGDTYYKCVGSGTLEKPDIGGTTPTYNCSAKQTSYKSITDKGANIIRSAYNCGSYISWSGGQFPIQMGDTCSTWMARTKSEIAEHNSLCPSNQVNDTLRTTNCNTCCNGSGTSLGVLSRCTDSEIGGNDVLVPQL